MHEIIRLGRDRIGQLGAFLRSQYGEAHYGADDRYMRWLYLDSPCDWFKAEAEQGHAPVNVILGPQGELAAVHAFLPFDAHTPWGGRQGIWDIEWINGLGIPGAGRQLAKALLADVDIYVGFGCNELSERAFNNLGLSVVPEIPRAVVVLSEDRLLRELTALGESPGRLAQAPAAGPRRWRVLGGSGEIPTVALEAYGARTPFGVGRGRDWLAWRYDGHPYLSYCVLTTDAATPRCAAVLRVETVTGRDIKVCRVLEFFADDPLTDGLAGAVVAYAQAHDCLFVDYFSSSASHLGYFEAGLAAEGLPGLRNPRIPFMTQPLQFGLRNSINMVIAAGGRAEDAAAAADLGQFHSGKGDANQDVIRRR